MRKLWKSFATISKFPVECADEDELLVKCANCPICELAEKNERDITDSHATLGMTNYDRIKQMSVEELAEVLYTSNDDICFKNCTRDTGNKYACKTGDETKPENCINCMKVWLESEFKEG